MGTCSAPCRHCFGKALVNRPGPRRWRRVGPPPSSRVLRHGERPQSHVHGRQDGGEPQVGEVVRAVPGREGQGLPDASKYRQASRATDAPRPAHEDRPAEGGHRRPPRRTPQRAAHDAPRSLPRAVRRQGSHGDPGEPVRHAVRGGLRGVRLRAAGRPGRRGRVVMARLAAGDPEAGRRLRPANVEPLPERATT